MKVLSGSRSRSRDIRTVERERLFEGAYSVWQTTAKFEEPFVRHLQIQEGWLWAGICVEGSVIVPLPEAGKRLCNRSQFLAGQGSLNAYLGYGRGSHSWVEFEIPLEEIRLLRGLSEVRPGATFVGRTPTIQTWEDAMSDTQPGAGLRWMSLLLDAFSQSSGESMESELSPPLRELTKSVRDDPAHPWTLQEAAYQAGYSPYHLSRAFKNQAGIGFPVFVQRCRASAAFEWIASGTESAETIARACGFGHAHAMRVALKDFCGFLPNEIRMLDVGIV